MWFCVISVPPPRLAPAARMVCWPTGVAEGKGQSWADGRGVGVGAWILFPPEQMRGWPLLEPPAPGSQGWGLLQGLMFRTSMSLGIFHLGIFHPGIPRSLGDWEQLDLAFSVPQ